MEKRLDLLGEETDKEPEPVGKEERTELLLLAGQLVQPEVSVERRMEIAFRMCQMLGGTPAKTQNENGRMQWEHPPPSSVSWG